MINFHFKLRDYQQECINAMINAKDDKRALIVAPTGSGKTAIFSYYTHLVKKHNGTVLIVVQKNELVKQTLESLSRYIDNIAVYNAGLKRKEIGDVTVASYQSLSRSSHQLDFNVFIIDEVHRFKDKYLESLNGYVIGFSATPFRHNNKIFGEDKFFKKITWQKSIKYMIENNYLVPPVYYANQGKDFDLHNVKKDKNDYILASLTNSILHQQENIKLQVEDALSRSSDHNKIIILTTCIEHAEIVHGLLENASIIHSKQSSFDRDQNMNKFKNGKARFLVSVLIASEGFDYPPATMLWFMRPTRSVVLYLQAVGRVLRPSINKNKAVILDYGQVVKSLGPIEDAFSNALKDKEISEPIDFCVHCFSYVPKNIKICPECGKENIRQKREKQKIDRYKNLTVQAHEEVLKIDRYVVKDYVSRSGNLCKRIDYYCGFITCSEFFLSKSRYSMKLYNDRLEQLKNDCEVEIEFGKFNKPKSIRQIKA